MQGGRRTKRAGADSIIFRRDGTFRGGSSQKVESYVRANLHFSSFLRIVLVVVLHSTIRTPQKRCAQYAAVAMNINIRIIKRLYCNYSLIYAYAVCLFC